MSEKRGSGFSELKRVLEGTSFSNHIVFEEVLESTNALAKDLAQQGAGGGTLVITDKQTAGRGRMGRNWLSPKGANLTFSILLRPSGLPTDRIFVLTMMLALAVIETLKRNTGLEPGIKWPNDIYVSGKKLGGILTEFSVQGNEVAYIILGLGLNINWHPGKEETGRYEATSILSESGNSVSRVDLLNGILRVFENSYELLGKKKIDSLYRAWNDQSIIQGKRVSIRTDAGVLHGRAQSIDRQGALILLDDTGEKQTVLCGDVSLTIA